MVLSVVSVDKCCRSAVHVSKTNGRRIFRFSERKYSLTYYIYDEYVGLRMVRPGQKITTIQNDG